MGLAASTLLVAVADEQRGEQIETAAREAGWSVTTYAGGSGFARTRRPEVADALILDEANARWLGRTDWAPLARLRILLVEGVTPDATPVWETRADAFLFEEGAHGFAQRIALAQAGYSSVPERLLPALLADEARIGRLAQLSGTELRLARLHLQTDTVKSLAALLGQSPSATRSALRRLLRALALPAKIHLASLFARAGCRPGRQRSSGSRAEGPSAADEIPKP